MCLVVAVLFQELPTYNEKRRGTISAATLRNLQRSRSNPQLSHLFQTSIGDSAPSSGVQRSSDTSPVRAAASSLSSAYQHHHYSTAAGAGAFVSHGRQHVEPARASILSNSGQTRR